MAAHIVTPDSPIQCKAVDQGGGATDKAAAAGHRPTRVREEYVDRSEEFEDQREDEWGYGQ